MCILRVSIVIAVLFCFSGDYFQLMALNSTFNPSMCECETHGVDPAVPEKINQTVITVGECTLRLSDVMTLIYGLSARSSA